MSKKSISALFAIVLGVAFALSAGSAFAGDGSCGGKKKDGDTAAVLTPDLPRV